MCRYVQLQGQLSKYLIYDLIYQFFHSYMKKSSKFSLKKKKKGLLIYLSSIKTKLAINFLKNKLLHLAEKRAGGERVNILQISPTPR